MGSRSSVALKAGGSGRPLGASLRARPGASGPRPPRPQVLDEVAVEVDRLLARLADERPLALAALRAHRPGERESERSRRPLRVVAEQQALRVLLARRSAAPAVVALVLAKLDLDDEPVRRLLELPKEPVDPSRRAARPPAPRRSTLVMTFRVRRSASTTSGPTASGTRMAASSAPVSASAAELAVERAPRGLLARPHRPDVAAEVLAEAEAQVLDELLPALGDVADLGVGRRAACRRRRRCGP